MGSAGTAVCTIMIMITVSLVGVFSAAIEGNSLAHGGSQNWPQHSQLTKRNAVQLCGSRLVEAVKGICRGHIFSGYNRRSDSSNLVAGGFSDDSQDMRDGESNSMDIGSDSMSAQFGGLDTYWDKDIDNTLSDLELLWPRNSKSLALKVLTESKAHQRFRRNISDECCRKPCSINDMVKYCGGNRRIALYQ